MDMHKLHLAFLMLHDNAEHLTDTPVCIVHDLDL